MSLNVSGRELRKIFIIVAICFVVSHVRRKEARKRWLGSQKKADDSAGQEKQKTRLVDHPFVPYLIENAAIIALPFLVRKIGVIDPQRPIASFLTFQLQSTILVNSGLLMQKFCADYLYDHVLYFTNTKPSAEWKDMAWDFMRNNFWNDIVLSFMQVVLIRSMPMDKREARHQVPFKVFPFLGKIFLGRFIVDVVFYLVHRWLHTDFGYNYIHYRHHEHRSPRTQTNYHFVPVDLFLEAGLPVIVLATIFHKAGIQMSSLEEDIIGFSHAYYESGSHLGKEIPIVTWIPQLSPIVDAITGCDQRLIEYHTRHHQLFNCNYSISPWPDKLMGSYQMEYQVKEDPLESQRK